MTQKAAPRKRNAEATAEAILGCAQEVFHEKGYEGATTREIAERAGVNMALITRYFGSKRGLFEKAILPHLSLERFLDAPVETLSERLVDAYIDTAPKERFDPFVVLLRSLSDAEVGPLLVDALEQQAIVPLSRALKGRDTRARATLIASQLSGLILRFRILQQPPRTKAERDAIRRHLSAYLDALVKGEKLTSG